MPVFSERSRACLAELHPDLQKVLETAIKRGPDFTILCGHRDERAQNEVFKAGTSKVPWPHSKHNQKPSRAADIAPWPVNWEDWNRFRILAGYILGVADALGIRLRWGGDWNANYDEADERFRDAPHFELV